VIDKTSINESLVVGRVLSGRTFSGKKIDYTIPKIYDVETSIDIVKDRLLDYLDKFKKPALLLSGGKDSRMIVSLLKELGKDTVCYTYTMRNDRYEMNELSVSKMVAEQLGYEHKTIHIDFNSYYNRELIKKIVSVTDGEPLFHHVLTMATIRDQIPEKELITGDLITELFDTGEYRPFYDGSDIKSSLYKKEKILNYIGLKDGLDTINRLCDMYDDLSIPELLLMRKTDRIIRSEIYKKMGYEVHLPALDPDTVRAVFSLPIEDRVDGNVPREIIKRTNKDMYRMRTARSPFSLRFPLSYHIAYARLLKRNVDNTEIPGSFDDTREYTSKIEKYRVENLRWWGHLNNVEINNVGGVI